MDVVTVAIKTREKLEGAEMLPPSHPEYGRDHIEKMLNEIISGQVTGPDARQWLGWAQCAVCVGAGATLEELIQINKQV